MAERDCRFVAETHEEEAEPEETWHINTERKKQLAAGKFTDDSSGSRLPREFATGASMTVVQPFLKRTGLN